MLSERRLLHNEAYSSQQLNNKEATLQRLTKHKKINSQAKNKKE